MRLSDIIKQFSDLKIHAKRDLAVDYCELVFCSEDTARWEEVIINVLGPAIKPPKADPSKEDIRVTAAYGGIRADQTLFKKDFEGYSIIAMFWPWQDHAHATLKIATIAR